MQNKRILMQLYNTAKCEEEKEILKQTINGLG